MAVDEGWAGGVHVQRLPCGRMSVPRPSAVLLAATAAAALGALAGCGKDEPPKASAQTQVREVVRRYGVAVSRKDYQQICDRLIAKALADNVEEIGLPCELAFKRGLENVRGAGLRIDGIDVRGTSAYVKVHTTAAGQPPSDDTLKLVRVGTGWRISSLSAAPPKPPAKKPPAKKPAK
ncbi:MAG: nuclear transport factor 2 family protein [Solirubrobacterales bacterium]|nr:nuclear transport factor 2 family protein [Solirubrobacterales bacterium]